jgi:hypothetical protein
MRLFRVSAGMTDSYAQFRKKRFVAALGICH